MTAAAGTVPGRPKGALKRFGRRKFDKQPTQHAAVLIASPFGDAIPKAAITRARVLCEGDAVAVVNVARVYGSSFGIQSPGLMPTRKEFDEQNDYVRRAITAIEKCGLEAWGQVAATRKPAKLIARVAETRGSTHVIVIRKESTGWRGVVEGDISKEIARKVGAEVDVETMSPDDKEDK